MNRSLAVTVALLVAGCSKDAKPIDDERDASRCIGTPAEVPDDGWLSDDGTMPPLQGQTISGTGGLTVLLDVLPRGLEVTRAEDLVTSGHCTIQRVVEAENDDGSLFIEQRQLDDTGTLFNVPLSGGQSREQRGRGELVTDDFNGDGNRLTALVITETGGWTLVVARGVNGPDLSGWPTTMATTQERAGEPGPAPLTLDEVVDLGEEISESTSTRPSR